MNKSLQFTSVDYFQKIRTILSREARFLISMLYGGAAFLSFILLAYFSNWKYGLEEAGVFLGFYSIVYSGGSFASLGLYSRAPSWVIRDRDAVGRFDRKKRGLILSSLIAVTLLSCVALVLDTKFWLVGSLPSLFVLAGILQVALLMLFCGISNGYRKFHCSRLNFVIAPNFVAILFFVLFDLSLMHALLIALMGCNVCHYAAIGILSKWQTDVPLNEAGQKVSAFNIKMILPVSILSILPQVDIWVLCNFLNGSDVFIYAFYARFLMIPMFPIIAFNNVMYSTLPGLAYVNDFKSIERTFFGQYKRVRVVIMAASLCLPLVAFVAAQMVGVPFDWRAIGLLLGLVLGYGMISLFPPYEVLVYAFEKQSGAFGVSIMLLLLTCLGIGALAMTSYFWVSPLVAAGCMLSMRMVYKSIYQTEKNLITTT